MTSPPRTGLSQGQHRYYSRSRQRNHGAAENDATAAHPAVPEHRSICPDEPVFITNADALAELLEHCRAVGSFAYDTEFIGELTYYPKLCVIQVATTDRVALVDPLSGLDLTPLWRLVADRSVETVVHAGVQDLEPVYRHTGRGPEGVFDTQIAMGFGRLPYPLSLREAVRVLLGAKLAKGMTFTQWDQRPLSPAQLRYAADDVRYLPALRAEIGRRLDDTGHAPWADQECETLADPALYEFDALTQCRRIRGARDLSARQLAVLAALVTWREARARHEGIPARALAADQVLKTMARRPPGSVQVLKRVASLPRRLIESDGERIVAAVAEALALDNASLPRAAPKAESALQRYRVDCAWAFVQAYCFGTSVHPNLVCYRQDLADLLADGPLADAIARSRLAEGWRAELVGDRLPGILAGTTSMQLAWDADGMRARLDARRPD